MAGLCPGQRDHGSHDTRLRRVRRRTRLHAARRRPRYILAYMLPLRVGARCPPSSGVTLVPHDEDGDPLFTAVRGGHIGLAGARELVVHVIPRGHREPRRVAHNLSLC